MFHHMIRLCGTGSKLTKLPKVLLQQDFQPEKWVQENILAFWVIFLMRWRWWFSLSSVQSHTWVIQLKVLGIFNCCKTSVKGNIMKDWGSDTNHSGGLHQVLWTETCNVNCGQSGGVTKVLLSTNTYTYDLSVWWFVLILSELEKSHFQPFYSVCWNVFSMKIIQQDLMELLMWYLVKLEKTCNFCIQWWYLNLNFDAQIFR